jgi:drug/metabolite transporter (DMT)-like permease
MPQTIGLLAAILSSAIGGTAIVATRYLAGALDPVAIGVVRFVGGILALLPVALLCGEPWPPRRDWPAVAGLGVLFFGLFPLLFNASLGYTTAARGALALSTTPLLTMLVGAALGIERLALNKSLGVLVAMAGVAFALGSGLHAAPPNAWLGDLLMVAGAFCMALYNVWSRPFIARSGSIVFTTAGMAVGAVLLTGLAAVRGDLSAFGALNTTQWLACAYLAIVCAALIFVLWAYALGRAPPTLVAVSIAVNPVTASLVGLLLLGEPITSGLIVGLVMVLAGIALASGLIPFRYSGRHRPPAPRP